MNSYHLVSALVKTASNKEYRDSNINIENLIKALKQEVISRLDEATKG